MSGLLSTLWSPVSAAWGFVKRHKVAVAVVAVGSVAAGGFWIYRKVKPLIDDVMAQMSMMEQLEKQMSASKSLSKKQM
jgi:hypothetical protein